MSENISTSDFAFKKQLTFKSYDKEILGYNSGFLDSGREFETSPAAPLALQVLLSRFMDRNWMININTVGGVYLPQIDAFRDEVAFSQTGSSFFTEHRSPTLSVETSFDNRSKVTTKISLSSIDGFVAELSPIEHPTARFPKLVEAWAKPLARVTVKKELTERISSSLNTVSSSTYSVLLEYNHITILNGIVDFNNIEMSALFKGSDEIKQHADAVPYRVLLDEPADSGLRLFILDDVSSLPRLVFDKKLSTILDYNVKELLNEIDGSFIVAAIGKSIAIADIVNIFNIRKRLNNYLSPEPKNDIN